jgi:hypothetical protein
VRVERQPGAPLILTIVNSVWYSWVNVSAWVWGWGKEKPSAAYTCNFLLTGNGHTEVLGYSRVIVITTKGDQTRGGAGRPVASLES